MTAVTKSSVIRIKALGLHWRGPRLLAFEVYDHEGRLKGVRPLGGGVEFGECAKDAVIREFKEEIDIEVSILAGPMVLENVFVHEGERRHEILFIFDLAFPPGAFEAQERIRFQEDDGTSMVAAWYDPRELDMDGSPELYPNGLKTRLLGR
ncbi:NUDIX domain-containing protein (plasmid) [Agrobacterium tumefaciens]|uniref:NUDIX hydrolase n=1 Tax=Agrobacterium tumefaciens TaxID=358 RepID=UPI00157426D6|nr:NUDIX domain-containing protein [Agrobacterium tumefaciens]NSZ87254.1 NUDIX domain-containing protein [Agrobacterium tumefaciens]WCA72841.1 NUDIX domain-containing protein [Agrobacterium tumefaciens]